MAFWNKTLDSNDASSQREQLVHTEQALSQARRRLLGAAILLILACGLIPWMLDSTPRAWGEDVILRMPKAELPYQAKPAATTPSSTPSTAASPNSKSQSEIKP